MSDLSAMGVQRIIGTLMSLGDQALLVRYDCAPSLALSRGLARRADQLRVYSFCRDVVIAYQELVVYVDPLIEVCHREKLQELLLEELVIDDTLPSECDIINISVHYETVALDALLEELCCTPYDVWRMHSGQIYTVAFMGFRPYFPYLLGENLNCVLPGKSGLNRCRQGQWQLLQVKRGIYPDDGWGGWWRLGCCDPSICRSLTAGERLRFEGAYPC